MTRSLILAAIITTLGVAMMGCAEPPGTPAPASSETAQKAALKGGNNAGGGVANLNPNYHGSAAADDLRTGSALKGK